MAAADVEPRIVVANTSPWRSIIEWLRKDEELRDWLTENEQQLLVSDRAAELPIWKALLTYQGFDIIRIIKLMIAHGATYKDIKEFEQVEIKLKVRDAEQTFRYDNHRSLAGDIEFLIFLFSERGSTNEKYTNKSLPEVTTIANWLIEKYKIDVRVNEPLASLPPDTITIPRIVACFPSKICEYFHLGFGNALLAWYELNLDPNVGYSRALLCPHYTALIPKEIMRRSTNFHRMAFLVHVAVDDVLHKKKGNFTPLENILIYYAAEYHSDGSPEAARVAFGVRWGLLDPHGQNYIPALLNQTDWCTARIRALRPNDPKLEQIFEDLDRLI